MKIEYDIPLCHKICNTCLQIKPNSAFYLHRGKAAGTCKECKRTYQNQYHAQRSKTKEHKPTETHLILTEKPCGTRSQEKCTTIPEKTKSSHIKYKEVLERCHDFEFPNRLYWVVDIKLKSPNQQMHWQKKAKIVKLHHKIMLYSLPHPHWKEVELPCRITLRRISPRKLDFDNLVYAFKGIRDSLADFMIPGHPRGFADNDKRISWEYDQATSFLDPSHNHKKSAIEIEIEY